MKFDRETEERMLKEAEPRIRRVVTSFVNRGNTKLSRAHYQDLYQEAAIVYLRHIRRAETEETMKIFPTLDMICAMCFCVLGTLPVSYPKRTGDFKKRISQTETIPMYEAESELISEYSMDDVTGRIALTDFISRQTERNQRMIAMRAAGKQTKEIAKELGLSNSCVSLTMSRMLEKYHKEIAA